MSKGKRYTLEFKIEALKQVAIQFLRYQNGEETGQKPYITDEAS